MCVVYEAKFVPTTKFNLMLFAINRPRYAHVPGDLSRQSNIQFTLFIVPGTKERPT